MGPHFWCPPPELSHPSSSPPHTQPQQTQPQPQTPADTAMSGTDAPTPSSSSTPHADVVQGRRLRPLGLRYREQIAEDVVWDIVDEVDFFVQDGGWEYKGEPPPICWSRGAESSRAHAASRIRMRGWASRWGRGISTAPLGWHVYE